MIEIIRAEHNKVTGLPQFMKPYLMENLVIKNPVYAEAVKYGRWTRNVSKFLTLYRDFGKYITVPRGFYENLVDMVESTGENYEVKDERTEFPRRDVKHKIILRDTQKPAANTMLAHTNGLLVAPPGAGKTIVALYMVAKLGQPTLWITHTKRLFKQVIDRATSFMDVGEIGRIVSGAVKLENFLNIAMVQSMVKKLSGLRGSFGTVILDECHHCPAISFSEVVNHFDARYVFGLTATAYRRDGLEPLLFHALGPIRATISRHDLIKAGEIVVPKFIQQETGIEFYYDGSNFGRLVTEITRNTERNELIVGMVLREVLDINSSILVLTARVAHARKIYRMLSRMKIPVSIAVGKETDKRNTEAVEKFIKGESRVLVATYQYIGEGFDHFIDKIFILTPIGIRGKTTIVQIVGRAQRSKNINILSIKDEDATVYDFVDNNTLLEVQANARVRNLREEWGEALIVERVGRK